MRGHRLVSDQDLPIRVRCIPNQLRIWSTLSGNALGPIKQKFSFVASYDELKGHTVKEALEMIGANYIDGYYVSAVIFPLRTDIYPANARGVLQVISSVEGSSNLDTKEKFLGPGKLNADELDEFGDTGIPSYRIDAYKKFYPHYCELGRAFFAANTRQKSS